MSKAERPKGVMPSPRVKGRNVPAASPKWAWRFNNAGDVFAVLFAFGKVSDEAPWSERLTEYDEAHFFTYARLLDLLNQGKTLKEISQTLFEIDAEAEPERAQKCFASHVKRAKWATTTGYQLLLKMPDGFQMPPTDKRH